MIRYLIISHNIICEINDFMEGVRIKCDQCDNQFKTDQTLKNH